jgi:hypothetical protein
VAAGSSSCSCDFLVNGFVGPTMFTLPLCPTRRRHKSATKGFAGATLQPTKRSESESSMQSCSDLLHQRLRRPVEGGLWRKVFHELLTDRNNRYLMIHSTIVQAHTIKRLPVAKGGSNKAPGYSRGSLTTEIPAGRCAWFAVDSSLSHTLGDTSAICRDCLAIAEDEKI